MHFEVSHVWKNHLCQNKFKPKISWATFGNDVINVPIKKNSIKIIIVIGTYVSKIKSFYLTFIKIIHSIKNLLIYRYTNDRSTGILKSSNFLWFLFKVVAINIANNNAKTFILTYTVHIYRHRPTVGVYI